MGARLNANIVNAFLVPALEQLRLLAGSDSTLERLDLVGEIPASNLTVRIDIHGGLEGVVYWSFEKTVAVRVARKMLPQLSVAGANEQAILADALGELANIIVGNATGTLLGFGYRIEFQTPSFETDIAALRHGPLNLVLITPVGRVRMVFCIGVVSPL